MTTIVLFGGRSDERHVSVASAQNVTRLLDAPRCWFWATDGSVYAVELDELQSHQRPFEIDFMPTRSADWPSLDAALDNIPVDDPIFLLAFHGGEGEDGTVQRLLEARGLPFTGSGSGASAIAFDKGRAKEAMSGRVRTAESRVVRNPEEIAAVTHEMMERHPKIVLKPLAGGSSRGLFFLERDGDLQGTIEQVAALGIPYIIEQFISGRELTVGVADLGEGAFALPVIEIEVDAGGSFDYAGKYLGKGTREICPAKIPDAWRDDAQRTALAAHQTLGCEGYSRSDLIASDDGVYFLELNTLPGMTTSSLVPQQLREAGIDMREFFNKQLELAKKRAAQPTVLR